MIQNNGNDTEQLIEESLKNTKLFYYQLSYKNIKISIY